MARNTVNIVDTFDQSKFDATRTKPNANWGNAIMADEVRWAQTCVMTHVERAVEMICRQHKLCSSGPPPTDVVTILQEIGDVNPTVAELLQLKEDCAGTDKAKNPACGNLFKMQDETNRVLSTVLVTLDWPTLRYYINRYALTHPAIWAGIKDFPLWLQISEQIGEMYTVVSDTNSTNLTGWCHTKVIDQDKMQWAAPGNRNNYNKVPSDLMSVIDFGNAIVNCIGVRRLSGNIHGKIITNEQPGDPGGQAGTTGATSDEFGNVLPVEDQIAGADGQQINQWLPYDQRAYTSDASGANQPSTSTGSLYTPLTEADVDASASIQTAGAWGGVTAGPGTDATFPAGVNAEGVQSPAAEKSSTANGAHGYSGAMDIYHNARVQKSRPLVLKQLHKIYFKDIELKDQIRLMDHLEPCDSFVYVYDGGFSIGSIGTDQTGDKLSIKDLGADDLLVAYQSELVQASS